MSVIFFLMSISSMSHVDFKKWSYPPVKVKAQWPPWRLSTHVDKRSVFWPLPVPHSSGPFYELDE